MRIFLMQRWSAVALVIFLTLHMVVVHYPPGHIDVNRVLERLDDPVWKAIDIAFLAAVLVHALTRRVYGDHRPGAVQHIPAGAGLGFGGGRGAAVCLRHADDPGVLRAERLTDRCLSARIFAWLPSAG